MEWLRQNWFFLLIFVAFAGMHMFGHRGHGGHGGHGGHSERAEPRDDERARSRETGSEGTNGPGRGPQSPHDHGAAS